MNRDVFIDLLESHLRNMFIQIRHGNRPAEAERRYCEGLVHGAQALNAFSSDELQAVIEQINMEVFGTGVAERMQRFPLDSLSTEPNTDIPAYIRKGIRID